MTRQLENNSAAVLETRPDGNLMDASREWSTRPNDQRFQDLDALKLSVDSRRDRSTHVDVDLSQLLAIPYGADDIQLQARGDPLTLTNWSFGQLAQTVKAPAAYLRSLPADLAIRNINHGLLATKADRTQRSANKLLMIRPEEDDSRPLSAPDLPSRLQAVTSPTYGRIWDSDCVQLVERLREKSGGKFTNPLAYLPGHYGNAAMAVPSGLYASDHDIFVFMVDGGSRLDAGPRAQLNRGFFLKNSETCACTFQLCCFMFNTVCGNHIIWSAQNVNQLTIRHSSGGPYRFDSEAWPVLKGYIDQSAAPEEATIKAAQAELLPTEEKDLTAFASRFQITKPELRQAIKFANAEEGECRTTWQLVQGLTASAREISFTDNRVNLETRAGKILDSIKAPSAPVTVPVDGFRN